MNIFNSKKKINRRCFLISIVSIGVGLFYFKKGSKTSSINDNIYRKHFRNFINQLPSTGSFYGNKLLSYATLKNKEKLFLTFKHCLDKQIISGYVDYRKIMQLMARYDFNRNSMVRLEGWMLSESEVILMSLTDVGSNDNRL